MKRRDFITLLFGFCTVTVRRARAANRLQLIAVLMANAEDDPNVKTNLNALREGLHPLGWIDEKNVQLVYRATADLDTMWSRAVELVSLGPDVMVTVQTPATSAARQASRSIPIVFIAVSDPIGAGFVESFPRPGGNITGFTNTEATMGAKWLGLLRDMAPSISRVSMLFNPETANAGASGGLYLKSIETAAQLAGTELIVSAVHDPSGIDEAFAAIAQRPGGGVLVMPNAFTIANRERIVAQAARYLVPTIYPLRTFVTAGGLLSYGNVTTDLFRRAASYVDRILRGTKVADLPVQAPTKYELVINLKTAKALGLTIPQTLLATADEMIE
jgi:putative ABC transport system substrate-binding protein